METARENPSSNDTDTHAELIDMRIEDNDIEEEKPFSEGSDRKLLFIGCTPGSQSLSSDYRTRTARDLVQ